MAWITSAANFLLSEWLWNVTWGWYHIPVNIFILLFLLKFFGGLRIVPAVLISFFAQIFSLAVLSALVILIPVSLLGLKFIPYDCYVHQTMHPLLVCLSLGGIYFVMHVLFFALVNLFYSLNLKLLTLIAFVANGLSAVLVYRFWALNVL